MTNAAHSCPRGRCSLSRPDYRADIDNDKARTYVCVRARAHVCASAGRKYRPNWSRISSSAGPGKTRPRGTSQLVRRALFIYFIRGAPCNGIGPHLPGPGRILFLIDSPRRTDPRSRATHGPVIARFIRFVCRITSLSLCLLTCCMYRRCTSRNESYSPTPAFLHEFPSRGPPIRERVHLDSLGGAFFELFTFLSFRSAFVRGGVIFGRNLESQS